MDSKKQKGKSPKEILVSLCQKYKLKYEFSDWRQDHLKVFHCNLTTRKLEATAEDVTMSCTVEGQGLKKKNTEHHACLLMIRKLSLCENFKVKIPEKLTLPKNVLGSTKSPDTPLHPVSRLLQIAHAKKIPAPVFKFEVLADDNKKSIHTATCTLGDKTVVEQSTSKKEAKLKATNSMLCEMGFSLQASKKQSNKQYNNTIKLKTLDTIPELCPDS